MPSKAIEYRVISKQQGAELESNGSYSVAFLLDENGQAWQIILNNQIALKRYIEKCEKNFPMRKPPSALDVPLADGTGDDEYLSTLGLHLPQIVSTFRPDLAFFLAGVDVVAGDRFGRLALTEEGLARRDRFTIESIAGAGIPLCMVLAGGYARSAERTAELHAHAHREARRWLRLGR